MNNLQKQIINVSKDLGLTHISSNLSCLPVLLEIYNQKKSQDIVILDNAHAHLSHLVVKSNQEKLGYELGMGVKLDIKHLIETHGIHCDRLAGCDASGGSLGHGLGIGIGYALSSIKRHVYVIVSEGSMMEGSSWEALRLIGELKVTNLSIYTNFNGFSAVAKIDTDKLIKRMETFDCRFYFRKTDNTKEFAGVAGHYTKL